MRDDSKKTARGRAEAHFEKKQKTAREGRQAMAEYQAAAKALDEKTARLRALRLAKEKAEEQAPARKPAPRKRKPAARKPK